MERYGEKLPAFACDFFCTLFLTSPSSCGFAGFGKWVTLFALYIVRVKEKRG
jgi:hypothetical protein